MRIHHEWAVGAALQDYDAMVIVDCLSFSTAVSVATNQGAYVYPFQFKTSAQDFAKEIGIICASKREAGGISLSPKSLSKLCHKQKIILPSPNGASLSLLAKAKHVYCASLRNAKFVAEHLMASNYANILIISAGERWYDLDKTTPLLEKEDNRLRPCFEDVVASGAVLSYLQGELTPEAKIARASFDVISDNLLDEMMCSISGKELIDRGFAVDVEFAAKLNVDHCVPKLVREDDHYGDFGVTEIELEDQHIGYYKNVI